MKTNTITKIHKLWRTQAFVGHTNEQIWTTSLIFLNKVKKKVNVEGVKFEAIRIENVANTEIVVNLQILRGKITNFSDLKYVPTPNDF